MREAPDKAQMAMVISQYSASRGFFAFFFGNYDDFPLERSCGLSPHAALAQLGRNSPHLAEAISARWTANGKRTLPVNGGEKGE